MSLEALFVPARPAEALLVLLHGWGANAQDVAALAQYIHLPQLSFAFPNAPFAFPHSPTGRMWYDLPADYRFFSQPGFRQSPQLQTSRQALLDWLHSLESSTGIPLARTVLAGFSQGGAMTLEVGLNLPVAGLMVLSGYAHAPLELTAELAAPILLVHGRADQVVPLRAAQQVHDALAQAGAAVEYHELNMGHEIQPAVLKLMQSFVEETVFPPNSPEKRSRIESD
ncbi:MAG: dienelactone hydrolase family protein [Pegethrix bostrychoides GSE-TBD4-15B]|jgi:phospholipase/carboxylesterase|uniref:Dienelactone hydrolase family protein n=1 Tax=Pegethrix bostrychoides GSE-TBD4-15B TaxID=2839662 RepID=A0A951PBT0_9CYAN|nr:dienelactone hydrolase family protein [Pegethrix bostrychoides GSE-TBD4-15B]